MIISPVVSAFFTKYKLLFQLLAVLLAIIAIMILWDRFIAEPYRDQGRLEIQAKFDAHLLADREAELKAKDEVRAKESLDRIANTAIINKLYEEKDHAIKTRDAELADLRAGVISMRRITGKNEAETAAGMPSTGPGSEGGDGTCTVSIPAEIGEAVIGAKHEAAEVAARLAACQATLLQDRLTCNRK